MFFKYGLDLGVWIQECNGEEDQHITTPAACEPFMRPDIHRPFSAKHGLQQASIIGNMEDYDLLEVGHANEQSGFPPG
jgi:hypothetical protein